MKKLLINIALLIGVGLIVFWGTRRYYPRTVDRISTDTVYVDKPYIVKVFEEVEKPVRITKYKPDTVQIRSVEVKRDTVYVNTDSSSFAYSPNYLTNYTAAPKFLGAKKESSQLELTYMRTNGAVEGKKWNINGRNWHIGLNSTGTPVIRTSSANKINFSQSIQAGYLISSYRSPYLEYNVNLTVFGVTGTGSVNINSYPFVSAGVKYTF